MLFTEFRFWGFLAVVGALYAALPHRAQNRMLLVASYVFYGAWDWRFLSLIAFSTVVDYVVAGRMAAEPAEARRRLLLGVSLATNLGMLGVFKYLGFFVEGFAALVSGLGLHADPVVLQIVLPVGISFYTFQTLSYTIDVYRRDLAPAESFLDFALFVAFFPQLVAGPIERARNLLPEIERPRSPTWDGFRRGVVLCLLGLVKKVVVADGVAPSVDAAFASPDPTRWDVILGTWLFAVQIYGDFSGYTDIARGVAKMLGFGLMRNFAQPYFAANPQEFWRRWHISLSTWLRDYLYVPLGGNRGGRWRTWRNLMTTMVLGGLWHGAAWNFVLWGAYQGALLSLHRAWAGRARGTGEGMRRGWQAAVLRVLAIAAFFQVVCYGWLLFRAASLEQVGDLTWRIAAGAPGVTLPAPPDASLLGIVLVLGWDAAVERTGDVRFYERWPLAARAVTWAVGTYALAFGATVATSAFIYFQF